MSAESPQDFTILALTRGLARGDAAAYREFFARYHHRLTRYLFVVCRGNDQRTRDALPLLMDRVVRHARAFEKEEVFWSWLTVLARSAAVDECRRHSRYFAFLERFILHATLERTAAALPAPPDRWDALLEDALAALPQDERSLIEAKYFSRKPVDQIAAETQATPKSVESRLTRIRRKLRASMLKSRSHE